MNEQDKWINDPHEGVVKDVAYWAKIEQAVFARLKKAGMTPEQIRTGDDAERKRYREYLKNNP